MAGGTPTYSNNIFPPWFEMKLGIKCCYPVEPACRNIKSLRAPINCLLRYVTESLFYILKDSYDVAFIYSVIFQYWLKFFFYHNISRPTSSRKQYSIVSHARLFCIYNYILNIE